MRQIPRYGVLWLLVAFAAAVAPLVSYLPGWVAGVAVIAALWRLAVFRARIALPGRKWRILLVFACFGGLFYSFPRFQGLEPMVSMLVCAYALKLLEMRGRRDALVVIYLGYFLATTLALFDQGIVSAIYIFGSILLVTAGLAGLHQTEGDRHYYRPLSTALRILLQAVPLMVVLFVVLPRLGPLWGVPSPQSGTTGFSETLAPGDINQLVRSSKVAFRVAFEGDPPPPEQRYWRGMTLSIFDGRSWRRSQGWGYEGPWIDWVGGSSGWWLKEPKPMGQPLDYSLTLERHNGVWLFAMAAPQPLTQGTGVQRDFTLLNHSPITSRMHYRVRSWPEAPMDAAGLSPLRRRIELGLPEKGNDQTREVARSWRLETPDPNALIERLLGYFNRNFIYTLEPPTLGEESVDEFLWGSRQGYCGHFAASFVFFMRAAGIPARVVTGYQGGELHPSRSHLTVRQYDAHAWAEVWLAGRGWTRIDPTAAVAPERVRLSILELFSEENPLSDSPLAMANYRNIRWINSLRLQLDALEYSWATWVLGYEHVQYDLLRNLLGKVDPWRLALFLLLGAVATLMPTLLLSPYWRRRSSSHPLDRLYLVFCRRLARAGCQRNIGETPQKYAERSSQVLPHQAEIICDFTETYERLRYGGGRGEVSTLKKKLRQFRPRKQIAPLAPL